jgi:hypothetical protein
VGKVKIKVLQRDIRFKVEHANHILFVKMSRNLERAYGGKRGFCQYKGRVIDNTNYIVVTASGELSGIKDSQF